MMRDVSLICILVCFALHSEGYQTAVLACSADATTQPVAYSVPPGSGPFPLVVILHSWGGSYLGSASATDSAANNWGMAAIAPNYRGPNDHPEACMSPLAQQDILDALNWMQATQPIDPARVYLLGSSGGGHAAMMMAAKYPNRWTAVSTWVGISDLAKWWDDYAEPSPRHDQLTGCCGGPPVEPYLQEYCDRSPVQFLSGAFSVPLEINSGIHDQTVRPYQQIDAFNALALAPDVIAQTDVDYIVNNEAIPPGLVSDPIEPRSKPTLFARESGQCRLVIFDGGHELSLADAFRWLALHTAPSGVSGWMYL